MVTVAPDRAKLAKDSGARIMTKPRTAHRQHGLTTSEMVVYPMIAALLVGVAFGF